MLLTEQKKQENIIYLLAWLMMLIAPILSVYARFLSESMTHFNWMEVFLTWLFLSGFLLAFLIHNFLLAPLLVYKKRRRIYIVSVLVLILAFQVVQSLGRPDFFVLEKMDYDEMEERDSGCEASSDPKLFQGEWHSREGKRRHREPPARLSTKRNGTLEQRVEVARHRPPLLLGHKDLVSLVILILLLGLNLFIKYYFRLMDERKDFRELERKNLEQQLQYLKYQINPHFFMNTLNNIHALVDIDPEKAKKTIEELSKMMRYVLYEGNKKYISLNKEITFISGYVKLMRIRYSDKVRITTNLPEPGVDKLIPPLLFVTFVENAFKHGVSYKKESFIDMSMALEGNRLTFECHNSKIPKDSDSHGGVGLINTRKRLDLIFGRDYSLDIKDGEDDYRVKLDIPVKSI